MIEHYQTIVGIVLGVGCIIGIPICIAQEYWYDFKAERRRREWLREEAERDS